MDKKKLVLIGSIIVIIVCVGLSILLLTKEEKEPNSPNNSIEGLNTVSKDLLKDTKLEKLTIKNQSVFGFGSSTKILATIENTSDVEFYIDRLYITFEVDGKLIKILLFEDTTISPKEEKEINMISDRDLTKATSIKYVIENDKKVE